MKRLWLVIFCFGIACSILIVVCLNVLSVGCPPDTIAGKADSKQSESDKDAVLELKGGTIREKLLSLGDERKNVQSVYISGQFTDDDVAALRSLPNLQAVAVFVFPVPLTGDESVVKLTQLPNLREIKFHCAFYPITDTPLQSLCVFKKLEKLALPSSTISDDGLAVIGGLNQLRTLELYMAVNITDVGLAHLRNLTELEELSINGASLITSEGLSSLSHLTSLKRLSIQITNIDGEERRQVMDKLQQALPDCKIVITGLLQSCVWH